MLQSTPLQRNGPKSDNDMDVWCMKTCQDHEDRGFVELIYKLHRRLWCIVELIYKLPRPLEISINFWMALNWENHEVLQLLSIQLCLFSLLLRTIAKIFKMCSVLNANYGQPVSDLHSKHCNGLLWFVTTVWISTYSVCARGESCFLHNQILVVMYYSVYIIVTVDICICHACFRCLFP